MTRTPKRITLKRTKGWRLPEGTVVVSRGPGRKWGNPYEGDGSGKDHAMLVSLFARLMERPEYAYYRLEVRLALRGKDLACWCREEQPCHADVLLEIANADRPRLDRFKIGD